MLPESAHTERDTTQQMYTRACTHAHAHTHTHTYKEWQRTKHTVCVNTFGVSLGTLEQKARFKMSHGTVRSSSEYSESVCIEFDDEHSKQGCRALTVYF